MSKYSSDPITFIYFNIYSFKRIAKWGEGGREGGREREKMYGRGQTFAPGWIGY